AERDAAIHAPGALPAQLLLGSQREVLPVVVHAFAGVAFVEPDPVNLQKCAKLAHRAAEASNAAGWPNRVRACAFWGRGWRAAGGRLCCCPSRGLARARAQSVTTCGRGSAAPRPAPSRRRLGSSRCTRRRRPSTTVIA